MPQPHSTHTRTSLLTPLSSRADLIRALDHEVDRLLQAKWLLSSGLPASHSPWPKHTPTAKLVELMRTPSVIELANPQPFAGKAKFVTKPKRQISPAGRRRMQLAQRRRWARFRLAQAAERKAAARQKKQSAVA